MSASLDRKIEAARLRAEAESKMARANALAEQSRRTARQISVESSQQAKLPG